MPEVRQRFAAAANCASACHCRYRKKSTRSERSVAKRATAGDSGSWYSVGHSVQGSPKCSLSASKMDKDSRAGPLWSTNRSNSFRRRSEEHTSELQSLMRISYAVFCLKKKKLKQQRL